MNRNTREDSREYLLECLKLRGELHTFLRPGDQIFLVKGERIDKKGRLHSLRILIGHCDNGKISFDDITLLAAVLLDLPMKEAELPVEGSGLVLVERLAHRLFPAGFGCIGKGCPSMDHFNGDNDWTPYLPEDQRRGADGQLCRCHSSEHWHIDGRHALVGYLV